MRKKNSIECHIHILETILQSSFSSHL